MTPEPRAVVSEQLESSCSECGFDWTEPVYELLVGQCMHNVAVFGGVLSQIDPTVAVDPGLWSASRYVWHTVDVLRFGTERLWTISADPSFGVPIWDENVLADVRSYDKLSPFVGLIALIAAADAWRTAAFEAPHDVTTHIPKPARSVPSMSSSATRTRSAITSGTCDERWATDGPYAPPRHCTPSPSEPAPPRSGWRRALAAFSMWFLPESSTPKTQKRSIARPKWRYGIQPTRN